MQIEPWDRTSMREQETLVGRDRKEGAPLSGGTEFTEPDFDLQGRDGPLIAVDAHVRLAHPKQNNGAKMLRRGYNFTDGSTTLGGWTPACSSSPSCATPRSSTSRCRRSCPARTP